MYVAAETCILAAGRRSSHANRACFRSVVRRAPSRLPRGCEDCRDAEACCSKCLLSTALTQKYDKKSADARRSPACSSNPSNPALLSAIHPAAAPSTELLPPSTHRLDSAVPQSASPPPKIRRSKRSPPPPNSKKPNPSPTNPPSPSPPAESTPETARSLNPNVPAVRIRTSQPVTIQNSIIVSRSTLIDAFDCDANLTVQNTSGYALNPNVYGQIPGRFLDVDGFSRISVYNNYLEGTSGIYLYDYLGNHAASQSVRILYNSAKNIDGRFSNGRNGFLTGSDDNQFVQFFQINGVHNLPGIEVAWNQVINDPGRSRVEESINIHDSSGTPTSPILIHNNYIQGAYAANPNRDTAYTGGGIMLSDNGTSHTRAFNNQIVSTSHQGISISSGYDNDFYNNRIISSGYLPNGRLNPAQNVVVRYLELQRRIRFPKQLRLQQPHRLDAQRQTKQHLHPRRRQMVQK